MEINILNSEKNQIEAEFENTILTEILRVYLNKDSTVTFVAWKREHPTKKPILLVKTKGKTASKAINDAIKSITKDLDGFYNDFKKIA